MSLEGRLESTRRGWPRINLKCYATTDRLRRFVGIGTLAGIYEVQYIELSSSKVQPRWVRYSHSIVVDRRQKVKESWPSRDEVIVVTLSRPRQGEQAVARAGPRMATPNSRVCLEVGSVSSSVSEVSDARRYPSFCRDWGEPPVGTLPWKFACD